jgi:uncharacterized protein
MKTFFFILCFGFTMHVYSQSAKLLENNFEGSITHDGSTIQLIFKTQEEQGVLTTYLYIPQQLVFHKKANRTIINDSIRIEFRDFQAHFEGEILNEQGVIDGNWVQRGQSFPLVLTFKDELSAAKFHRPQTPQPPFSYIVQEHSVPNKKEKIQLSGTLTIPDTLNKYPLAILITGSGPQDRNEEIAGHKPFFVIADYMTSHGMAVFRYDDRGVAQSGGNFSTATSLDFMSDVLSIVRYFKKHPNINGKQIGLVGHSEGALIAMMAAARNRKDIAFVVSLAGPGVTIVELLLRQNEDLMKANGFDDELIEIAGAFQVQMYNMALSSMGSDEVIEQLKQIANEIGSHLSEKQMEMIGISPEIIKFTLMQLRTPWMHYFLAVNPADYLTKIKCPVLALNGKNDIQVASKENIEAIERFLKEGKNPFHQTQQFPYLNHLFQKSKTGNIDEYMTIEETFNMEVLQSMRTFFQTIQVLPEK